MHLCHLQALRKARKERRTRHFLELPRLGTEAFGKLRRRLGKSQFAGSVRKRRESIMRAGRCAAAAGQKAARASGQAARDLVEKSIRSSRAQSSRDTEGADADGAACNMANGAVDGGIDGDNAPNGAAGRAAGAQCTMEAEDEASAMAMVEAMAANAAAAGRDGASEAQEEVGEDGFATVHVVIDAQQVRLPQAMPCTEHMDLLCLVGLCPAVSHNLSTTHPAGDHRGRPDPIPRAGCPRRRAAPVHTAAHLHTTRGAITRSRRVLE